MRSAKWTKYSLPILAVVLMACGANQNKTATSVSVETSDEAAANYKDFRSYWNRGLAEMNRYELDQARYGDAHPGEAVLIFVTEPFLVGKQVKHEFGNEASQQVLKLNQSRRFYTGVYPYSTLSSTFTRIDNGETLKLTSNVQEWCGAAWLQLNKTADGWRELSQSYFQAEGDRTRDIDGAALEDALMTQIRIDPDAVTLGDQLMIPSGLFTRLKHVELKPYPANVSVTTVTDSEYGAGDLRKLSVVYREIDRALHMYYEPNFPHRIMGWEEEGRVMSGKRLSTKAKLSRSIMLDYWSKNNRSDAPYRDALGLEH